jgi:ATP-dependent Clp protease adaptor protein ClpS
METITEKSTEIKNRIIPPYKILLHNDDVNDMAHVIRSLMQVFKFDTEKSFEIMLEAHVKGLALCKTESKELCEFHREQLQSLSLTSTIEPA